LLNVYEENELKNVWWPQGDSLEDGLKSIWRLLGVFQGYRFRKT